MWEKCCGLNRFFFVVHFSFVILQWIFKDFFFIPVPFPLTACKGNNKKATQIYEMKGSYRHIPTVRFSPLSCNQLLSQTLTGCWQLSGLEQLLLWCAFWPADGSVSSPCGKQSNAHKVQHFGDRHQNPIWTRSEWYSMTHVWNIATRGIWWQKKGCFKHLDSTVCVLFTHGKCLIITVIGKIHLCLLNTVLRISAKLYGSRCIYTHIP